MASEASVANRASAMFVRFRRVPVLVLQLLLVAASNFAAFLLRFDNHPPRWALDVFWESLPWLLLIRGAMFFPFRLYEGLWRYTSIYDLQALLSSVFISSGLFFAYLVSPFGPPGYPRSIVVSDALMIAVLLGGIRLSRRIYVELWSTSPTGQRRVLIYGAGSAGRMIVREMRLNASVGLRPIGFIDDDPDKVGRSIHGIRVLGGRRDLGRIIKKYAPSETVIAMPGVDPGVVRHIVQVLGAFKLPIKTLPHLRDIIEGRTSVGQIRDLALEDLLPRAPVGLDVSAMQRLIRGRRVMVTGAGGSIGSELCRQIMTLKPAKLVLFERYENSLHAIRLELTDAKPAAQVFAVVGDVTDRTVVEHTLAAHQPEIVFHAAAHKHVPLMEDNPSEAIKNNVRGTRLLAECAEAAGVDRFILISTDKAANPTSVMGASKRLAEMALRLQAEGSGTSFSIVRFGNVLGSNGSVVPRFLEQIRRGGPVTVTHPDVRRFFMTIPEAVQLVLHAASVAVSGYTYVLEMGEQLRLVDVAENLIRLSGLVPGDEIRIEFTGLRPGEKMFEELHGHDEVLTPSPVPKVQMVSPSASSRPPSREAIKSLEALALTGHDAEARAELFALSAGTVAAAAPAALEHVDAPPQEPAWSPVSPDADMAPKCPSCGALALHRSRARSMGERIRKTVTPKRLFRCDACSWRGWAVPVIPGIGALPLDDIDKDLTGLDAAKGPDRPSSSFSPRDLE